MASAPIQKGALQSLMTPASDGNVRCRWDSRCIFGCAAGGQADGQMRRSVERGHQRQRGAPCAVILFLSLSLRQPRQRPQYIHALGEHCNNGLVLLHLGGRFVCICSASATRTSMWLLRRFGLFLAHRRNFSRDPQRPGDRRWFSRGNGVRPQKEKVMNPGNPVTLHTHKRREETAPTEADERDEEERAKSSSA